MAVCAIGGKLLEGDHALIDRLSLLASWKIPGHLSGLSCMGSR